MSKENIKLEADVNNGQMIGSAQNVRITYQNPDYEKLVPLIQRIVSSELEKYTANAKTTALERQEEFTNLFLTKIFNMEHSIDELEKAFSAPSMQYDFFEAEKAYIKSGDRNKLDLLSSIVSERIRCVDETLKQITISESIKVVPLLNNKLLDVLAFTFILGHVKRNDIRTIDDLVFHLKTCVLPYCESVSKVENLDFQHLDYTRCSVKSLGSRSISRIFLETYPSAFFLPINKTDIIGVKYNGKTLSEWFPDLFVIRDGEYYFNVCNREEYHELVERNPFGAIDPIKQTASDFYQNHLPKEKDVERILIEKDLTLKTIFDCWSNGCSSLNLSSVGITIAIISINSKTNIGLNLDTWLS